MDVVINVALLLLGTIGTLAAFGGDTWLPGTESLMRRITRRGWVSLTSLSLALAIGVWKEVLTNESSAKFDQKIRSLQDGNTSLATQLEEARGQLAAQAQTSEIMALALSDGGKVSGASVSFSMTGRAGTAKNLIEFFLGPSVRGVERLVHLRLLFDPFVGGPSAEQLLYDDSGSVKTFPALGRALPIVHTHDFAAIPNAKLPRFGAIPFTADAPRIDPAFNSAALGFSEMTNKKPCATFVLELIADFADQQDLRAFAAAHETLGKPIPMGINPRTGRTIARFALPDSIERNIRAYWASAFSGARVFLRLPGAPGIVTQGLLISDTLAPRISRDFNSDAMTIELVPSGAPSIDTGVKVL